MKFSINWLREFVELPANVDALADLLTMSGIEIEGIETRGADFANVIVSRIVSSKQHPNADRLTVCEVDDGSGAKRQIVCGAKNYKVGDRVPLALPGAELAGGLKISATSLRGVNSEGMLCSAKELALSDDAAGLLILGDDAKIGAPIGELFPRDTILDVEITPNRGDLISHVGLAREIGALTNKRVVAAAASKANLPKQAATTSAVKISAGRECPFYSVRRIEGVKVGPSPQWLRTKIENVGIRAINNLVDVTNYVMLEIGQPLHAFDADKLRGTINVRLANDGEEFLALDGKNYVLKPDQLVIADSERAIAIAGVMGGEETGVSELTRNVLLEAAWFLPSSVRRTARELNLPSDSSYRFERGVDPRITMVASERATAAISRMAGGKAAAAADVAGKIPEDPGNVALPHAQTERVLGIQLEPKTTDQILQRFGLTRIGSGKEESTWGIPSYRRDLERDVDLIEEIVRVYGIGKIPSADRSRFTPASEADRRYDFENALRRDLVALGLNEVRTSSLISRSELAKSAGAVELRNPLSEDHVALRPALASGLMGAAARNFRAGAQRVALFEIGNIFEPADAKQQRILGLLLAGALSSAKTWRDASNRVSDFFDLKGILESAMPAAGNGFEFRRTQKTGFALAAEIFSADKRIGWCGQLARAEAAALSANCPILVSELGLEASKRSVRFRELERFPAITRDIAMFVPANVAHEQIVRVIRSANEPLLERVQLFDLFADSAGQARKSLAYSLTYRGKNRTLTNEEVNAVHAQIRERLRNEIGAELRE